MKSYVLILMLFCLLLPAVQAKELTMPTLPLRQQAIAALADKNKNSAARYLHSAELLARDQKDAYVMANELRYIAAIWQQGGWKKEASVAFTEAMVTANIIPEWNRRLYASIGVLEIQRQTGDLRGVRSNGLLAIQNGLLEKVAESGGAAETGRLFSAMDGVLSEKDHMHIAKRISRIDNPDFQKKAMHALNAIKPRDS